MSNKERFYTRLLNIFIIDLYNSYFIIMISKKNKNSALARNKANNLSKYDLTAIKRRV